MFTCGFSKFKHHGTDIQQSVPLLINNYSERTDHSKILATKVYNSFYFRLLTRQAMYV